MEVAESRPAIADKEKKFLVCLILAYTEGIRTYKSARLLQICQDLLGIKRPGDVTTYLKRVEEKKWITYDIKEKEFTIPEAFEDLNTEKHELQLKVKVSYEAVRQNNTD